MSRAWSEDRTLTQRQRNEVLRALEGVGLGKSEFVWLTKESRILGGVAVSLLEHRKSRYFYVFDFWRNQYEGIEPYSYYSPGAEERLDQMAVDDWGGRLVTVEQWATNLADELQQPDLWSVAGEAEALQGSWTGEPDNSSFSASEREDVSRKLSQVLDYVRENHSLTQEQLVMIEERFGYLDAATARLGRYDWVGLAFQTIVSVATALALDSAGARSLVQLFGQLLSAALRALPPLTG